MTLRDATNTELDCIATACEAVAARYRDWRDARRLSAADMGTGTASPAHAAEKKLRQDITAAHYEAFYATLKDVQTQLRALED